MKFSKSLLMLSLVLNVSLCDDEAQATAPSESATGHYTCHSKFDNSELEVKKLSDNQISFSLHTLHTYSAKPLKVRTGERAGTAAMKNNTATFVDPIDGVQIKFIFSKNKCEIKCAGQSLLNYGGVNVNPNGIYWQSKKVTH